MHAYTASVVFIQSCNNDHNSNPQPQRNIWVDAKYGSDGSRQYFKNDNNTKVSYDVLSYMAVDGDDVYYGAAGGYRKNGELVQLPEAKKITAVCIKNGTVYAAGTNFANDYCYWTGAQITVLPADEFAKAISLSRILVDDNNQVHLGGTQFFGEPDLRNSIYHWTNNGMYTLWDAYFVDMAVQGSDVHIIGYRNGSTLTGYWVNGAQQNLTGVNGGTALRLNHISVWDNDVYITSSDTRTLYWKNGQPYIPIDEDIHPAAVVVDNGAVTVGVNREPLHGPMNNDYYLELWKGTSVQPIGDGTILGMHLGN